MPPRNTSSESRPSECGYYRCNSVAGVGVVVPGGPGPMDDDAHSHRMRNDDARADAHGAVVTLQNTFERGYGSVHSFESEFDLRPSSIPVRIL